MKVILTGADGFIGKNFKKRISGEIIEVEKNNCWNFLNDFDEWNEVSLILHQ